MIGFGGDDDITSGQRRHGVRRPRRRLSVVTRATTRCSATSAATSCPAAPATTSSTATTRSTSAWAVAVPTGRQRRRLHRWSGRRRDRQLRDHRSSNASARPRCAVRPGVAPRIVAPGLTRGHAARHLCGGHVIRLLLVSLLATAVVPFQSTIRPLPDSVRTASTAGTGPVAPCRCRSSGSSPSGTTASTAVRRAGTSS